METKFLFLDTEKSKIIEKLEQNQNLPFSAVKEEFLNKTYLLKDNKSISELQSIIINCIDYHSEFLVSLNLPAQIDIRFLNTNIFGQVYNSLNSKEYVANTRTNLVSDNKLINPLINISTDLLKPLNNSDYESNVRYIRKKDKFLSD